MSVVVPGSTLQVIQLDGDALSIVGFAVSLSQSDVPYTIEPDAPVAASSTDLLVYGDTVTITGDLVNPGRTIAIYARQIVVGATAFISVSGADPLTTYIAGQPAAQTDTTDGDPGANGAPATNGPGAGTLILAAESIQSNGPDTGAGTLARALCLGQLQALLMSAMPAGMSAYQSTLGQATIPLAGLNLPVTSPSVTVTSPTVGNVQQPSGVTVLPFDPQTGVYSVELTFDAMTLQATVAVSFDNQSLSGPLTGSFSMTVTLPVTPPGLTPGSGAPAPTLTIAGLKVTADTSYTLVNDAIEVDLNAVMPAALTQALSTTLQPAIEALSTAAAGAMVSSQQGLILTAIGGTGGRGQDGHAGNAGTPGAPGQDTDDGESPTAPPPAKCVGGSGGTGGQGGNAGTSGSAGAGGSIVLNLVDAATLGVSAYANGGAGGPAATAGAPGAGGTGGTGGSYMVGFLSGPYQKVYAPNGPPGSPGAAASVQGAQGAMGTAGSALSNGVAFGQSASFSYAQLAPSLALYQLLFAQQAAKLAYLNAQSSTDYQNVITLYLWLQHVTQPFSGTPTPVVSGVTPTDAATRGALYQAVTLELARLNASLDYYGNPLNWVPVLTWSALDTFVGQLISLGQNVLTQFENASTPSAQATAAQAASQQLQASLDNIKMYEDAVNLQISALDAQITSLDTQVNAAITTIQNDFTTLQQQYTAAQTNCSFTEVLSALSSIVQLGLSDFYDVNDLTTALAVEGAGANLIQGAGNLVVQSTPSDSTYPALSAAWGSLASTLQQYGSNSALIMVQDQQFDTLLNTYYGGLPEASVVESAVNALINLIQTRNQALVNYTSQFRQLQRLQTEYAQKSAELENVAALLAAGQQPQLPDYLAFLQGSLTEIGNSVVDNLYQANQAFQYWSVSSQPFQVSGLDIPSLSIAAAQLTENVQDYLTGKTGRPFSAFNAMTYVVSAQTQPDAFARLAATGILVVQLAIDDPANPFQNYYSVTAETVSVTLPGITPPAGSVDDPTVLQLTLVQLGPDVLAAQDGGTMTFTHAPRPVAYEFNVTTNENTVQGTIGDATQGFTGLSPFATWSIDFTSTTNAWLTLSQVTSVALTFSGQLLGQNTTVKP